MTSRAMLAVTSRSRTAPPGPTRENTVVARAEPNWTEAIPPRTKADEGARARRLGAGAVLSTRPEASGRTSARTRGRAQAGRRAAGGPRSVRREARDRRPLLEAASPEVRR